MAVGFTLFIYNVFLAYSFFLFFYCPRDSGTTLKSVVHNLHSVWRQFLETVSSSGTDFLSLEHLGIILQCLAAKGHQFRFDWVHSWFCLSLEVYRGEQAEVFVQQ